MFEWAIEMDEEGMTIPYAPLSDDVRLNYGFVDTRGRPDVAADIAEGRQSLAMKDLLVRLARRDARIFSVGCDVGAKRVTDGHSSYYTAGGYIQIMHILYAGRSPKEYAGYGEAVAEMLEDRAGGHEWRLNLVLTPVQCNLDEYRGMTGSLWIWFHSFGDTKNLAMMSREAYIGNLGRCLLDVRNLVRFE